MQLYTKISPVFCTTRGIWLDYQNKPEIIQSGMIAYSYKIIPTLTKVATREMEIPAIAKPFRCFPKQPINEVTSPNGNNIIAKVNRPIIEEIKPIMAHTSHQL